MLACLRERLFERNATDTLIRGLTLHGFRRPDFFSARPRIGCGDGGGAAGGGGGRGGDAACLSLRQRRNLAQHRNEEPACHVRHVGDHRCV